jgi:hypothetical protein
VEQVEEYVVANKGDLVVMGSMALGGPSNQVSPSIGTASKCSVEYV